MATDKKVITNVSQRPNTHRQVLPDRVVCMRKIHDKSSHVLRVARGFFHKAATRLDPEHGGIPRTRTVITALTSLAIFFINGGLAIVYPNKAWLPVAYVVATTLDLAIATFILADLQQRSKSCRLLGGTKLTAA